MYKQAIAQAKALVYAGSVLGAIKYHLYLTNRPITYVALAKVLGMFSGGKVLSEALGNIMLINIENGEALYSAAVVGSKTGIPGDGFFKFARSQGFNISENEDSEYDFWCAQVKKLGYNPDSWVPQTVRPMIYVENIQISENLFFVMSTIAVNKFQRLVLLTNEGLFPPAEDNIKTDKEKANLQDYISANELLEEYGRDYDLLEAIDEFRSLRPEDRVHLLRAFEKENNKLG